jgi:hypothetical protein
MKKWDSEINKLFVDEIQQNSSSHTGSQHGGGKNQGQVEELFSLEDAPNPVKLASIPWQAPEAQ